MKSDADEKPNQDAARGVPLLDLSMQNGPLEAELLAAVTRVLRSQQFILGPEVAALEREIAAYLGCQHAIGVSSGTDALVAALLALDIGPGHEVITSPFSFFASVEAILRVGATPIFADVDARTFTLDASAIERAITQRTRALLPVHLFGQTAAMGPLLEIAGRRGILVIEDAAQAIGARDGEQCAGTGGAVGCFSFFPSKNLGGFGDGGLVTTNYADLAARLRRIRNHGFREKHESVETGGNYRLDELQAALLRVKLPHLEAWTEQRRAHASFYLARLESNFAARGAGWQLPAAAAGRHHVYNQFVIRCPERQALTRHLTTRGIGSAVYYPRPLHLQPLLARLGYGAGQFPVAEALCRDCLALPMSAELSPDQLERVSRALLEF